jgi:hypothetical protein
LLCQPPLQVSHDPPISRPARGSRLTRVFPAIDPYQPNRSQKWRHDPGYSHPIR